MDEVTIRKRERGAAAEWRSMLARQEASGEMVEGFARPRASARPPSGAGAVGCRKRTVLALAACSSSLARGTGDVGCRA